ncbi:MarR family transcriptional regulator [Streptomyces sp. NBC_00876]|uniref:MarR family winged helix-turn-helix transcriptional regulator n=1 Tax=Streptomyces sp. NBC_00876 TaxID=2975853 RepID=UPI00386E2A32|nr:MarR family transcriptional regulator [Streptomyces sp. NBC_00876]
MPDIGIPAELGALLAAVNRLVRRSLRGGLTGPPMPTAQAELLRLVRANPGIRVSEAAGELRLADNSVSTLVRQLAGLGLMVRERDPQDARAASLSVTPRATERLRDWDDRRAAVYREQWRRLSARDRTALAAAVPALRRLAALLHEESRTRTRR